MLQFVKDNTVLIIVVVASLIYAAAVESYQGGAGGLVCVLSTGWLIIKALKAAYGRYVRSHLESWFAGRKLLSYKQLVDAEVMTHEEYEVKAGPLKKLL